MDLSQSRKQHRSQRFPRRHLVELSERQALRLFKKHLEGKGDDSVLEQAFISAVKKSPSEFSVNSGIALAARAGWLNALEELLSVDLSTYRRIRERMCKCPLQDLVESTFREPLATKSSGRGWYVNSTLVYAITLGNVEMVKIMTKHMNVNSIEEEDKRTVIDDIYVVEDQDVRRQLLDVIVPKLKVSRRNVSAAVAYNDMETTKQLLERSVERIRDCAENAAKTAIKHGHDELARWIMTQPGFIEWKRCINTLTMAAIRCGNLGMVEFISTQIKGTRTYFLYRNECAKLWVFLQRKGRKELFREFVPGQLDGPRLPFSYDTPMSDYRTFSSESTDMDTDSDDSSDSQDQ